jgi:hypothetical protein
MLFTLKRNIDNPASIQYHPAHFTGVQYLVSLPFRCIFLNARYIGKKAAFI